MEQVQILLGYSQIDTTLRYATINQNNVKTSHYKYIGWFKSKFNAKKCIAILIAERNSLIDNYFR